MIMILKNIPVGYDLRQYNSTIPVPVWYGTWEIIWGAYLPQTRYQCVRFTYVFGGYQKRGENRIEFQVNSHLEYLMVSSKVILVWNPSLDLQQVENRRLKFFIFLKKNWYPTGVLRNCRVRVLISEKFEE